MHPPCHHLQRRLRKVRGQTNRRHSVKFIIWNPTSIKALLVCQENGNSSCKGIAAFGRGYLGTRYTRKHNPRKGYVRNRRTFCTLNNIHVKACQVLLVLTASMVAPNRSTKLSESITFIWLRQISASITSRLSPSPLMVAEICERMGVSRQRVHSNKHRYPNGTPSNCVRSSVTA
jgi:hypothetical protein